MFIRHKIDKKYNLLFFICSILAVLIATLYPFNFSPLLTFSTSVIIDSFDHATTFRDQVNNILLFIPLGVSFTLLVQNYKLKIYLQVILCILIAFSLSSTVEILQIFLPSRSPTPADIVNNSIGGFLGFICYYIWNIKNFHYTSEEKVKTPPIKSLKQTLGFFLGYVFLTLFISFVWQNATTLSNWDDGYPLILGNEFTGNRAWKGYISEIYIADKAISPNEVGQVLADASYFDKLGNSLLAKYQLQGKCCYQDKTGQLPQLIWLGQPTNTRENQGAFLSADHWLQTSAPVTTLNQRISESSEFTISLAIATSDLQQYGPARIISVSGSSLRRNWTLAQQGNSLDFRLRTPLTGENGTDLNLNIPHIFHDTYLHHLVITYSRGTIQVYVDRLSNFHTFNLLDLIPKEQRVFYYALTFAPLGISLGMITLLVRRKLIFYPVLFYSGVIIPSLFLESILVSESGKSFSFKNLLLGIAFTAGTMLILRLRATQGKTSS